MKSNYENKNLSFTGERIRRRQGLHGKVFVIFDYDGEFTREQGADESNEEYRQYLLDNRIEFMELSKLD